MYWLQWNAVLLYNLPQSSLLPVVERILQQWGIEFINVRSAHDLFTIPAYLSIVDPGNYQDEPWVVEEDELRTYFKDIDDFKCLSRLYLFTRPLKIPVPAVIQKRIVAPPPVITEQFLLELVKSMLFAKEEDWEEWLWETEEKKIDGAVKRKEERHRE